MKKDSISSSSSKSLSLVQWFTSGNCKWCLEDFQTRSISWTEFCTDHRVLSEFIFFALSLDKGSQKILCATIEIFHSKIISPTNSQWLLCGTKGCYSLFHYKIHASWLIHNNVAVWHVAQFVSMWFSATKIVQGFGSEIFMRVCSHKFALQMSFWYMWLPLDLLDFLGIWTPKTSRCLIESSFRSGNIDAP